MNIVTRIFIFSFGFSVLLNNTSALAMQEPIPSKADPRIRTASYTTNDMIHITSTNLNPVQIVFQEGEQIISFAGKLISSEDNQKKTNAQDWFLIASKNSIVLQPIKAEPTTFLFLNSIAPDGMIRHYRMQLDTNMSKNPSETEYEAVNIIYPEVIAAQRRAKRIANAAIRAKKAEELRKKEENDLTEWKLKQNQLIRAQGRNWKYLAQNINSHDNSCEIIGPERNAGISDDGITTSLLFAPHMSLPVPYILDQDGHESEVQHSQKETPDGVVMTLHVIAPKIILRRGKRVCAFVNKAYDPIGHQTGTGTVSPNIVRELIK